MIIAFSQEQRAAAALDPMDLMPTLPPLQPLSMPEPEFFRM
jgi:hypothetical protein